MPSPRNRSVSTPYPTAWWMRQYARHQAGWNGDFLTVYPYDGFEAFGRPLKPDKNGDIVAIDVPNCVSLHDFRGAAGYPSWGLPASNKAYERFREKALGDAAQLGTFAAEWRESLGMVTNRAIGLRKAYSALRKGDFRKALKELSVDPKRKHKNKLKNAAHEASGLWLEYWFGWSPSVNDMFTALEQLEADIPSSRFWGTASAHRRKTLNDIHWYAYDDIKATIRYKSGADVGLSNANLFLASQLGIVNPAAIAWEVIPFSFLVDWVFKVGNYIESFSDFVGCTLERPYSTALLNWHDVYYRVPSGNPADPWASTSVGGGAMMRVNWLHRPVPNWNVTANLGTSITRTATAVSLLTQVLSGSTTGPRL